MIKIGMSRKINLQKVGGFQYESTDFWLEVEVEGEDFKKEKDNLVSELNSWIEDYIKDLPEQMKRFQEAIPVKEPFEIETIVSEEQQARHDKKVLENKRRRK